MIALSGWINGTVDLTGKQVEAAGPRQNLDGWLNYNDKDQPTRTQTTLLRTVWGDTSLQLRYTTQRLPVS